MTRNSRSRFDRRLFLKAAGVSIALPLMESYADNKKTADALPTKRLVCIGSNLGFLREHFYPEETGRNYKTPAYLEVISQHRQDFTVFSGFDHKATNGHYHWGNFLCGQHVGDISLDQIVAEKTAVHTRIPSIHMRAGRKHFVNMSYNRQGVPIPMLDKPLVIYNKLFGTSQNKEHSKYIIQSGKSALDTVLDEARSMARAVSRDDRQKLQEYYTSLRAVEKRLHKEMQFLQQKPLNLNYKVPTDTPEVNDLFEYERVMYELMALALQTDMTRVGTLFIPGEGQILTVNGKRMDATYHALTHNGGRKEELKLIDLEHFKCLNRFLHKLKSARDAEGKPLLDSTVVLFGTGMGNASLHSNANLPTLVAGGGFKHGGHIANKGPHLLGSLYITLLNQLGIKTETFSNAKHSLEIS